MKQIAVLGLGKLGAPMAACFAAKGRQVTGVDCDAEKVKLFGEGRSPLCEPSLAELLSVNAANLRATTDVAAAVAASEASFIVVPTPSEPDGSFALRLVKSACEDIGRALRSKRSRYLVVLTSTVLPGDCESVLIPALESASGKKCGLDFGFCYSPEFIALGSVIHDLLNPDFILIGESDERSGDLLEEFYLSFTDRPAPVARLNLVNAELAKISVNSFLTAKITFANMLAEICERVPGSDVDAITTAMGLDSRIGSKYLKGGLAYGGPCFPRDNAAFVQMARRNGVEATLAETVHRLNARQAARLLNRVLAVLPVGDRVGVLGLAYKVHTDVIDASAGVELASSLAAKGISVSVWDPAAMNTARKVLRGSVAYAGSAEECVRDAGVVVLTTPWPQFRELRPAAFMRHPRRILIDCWRLLDRENFEYAVDYMVLGNRPLSRDLQRAGKA